MDNTLYQFADFTLKLPQPEWGWSGQCGSPIMDRTVMLFMKKVPWGTPHREKPPLTTVPVPLQRSGLRATTVLATVTDCALTLPPAPLLPSLQREVIGPEPQEGVLYILFYQIRPQ